MKVKSVESAIDHPKLPYLMTQSILAVAELIFALSPPYIEKKIRSDVIFIS